MSRRLVGDELFAALVAKLHEEADELAVAGPEDRLEELADVLEVVNALARYLDVSDAQLQVSAAMKRNERGSFDQALWLEG
jgi:predicted house-cleaning noncanonical NTP pyrophosphatase (MazG superfamily)